MRAVIQRVASASVAVKESGEFVSSIGQGLCVLIGISRDDTKKDIDYIVNKILTLKLFEDENHKHWALNVVEKGLEVLCISQITLYNTMKGTKLDFHQAMHPELSQEFYKQFLFAMRERYKPELVKEGKFGVTSIISINNDGPVTINLESPVNAPKNNQKEKKKDKLKEAPEVNDS